MDSSSFSSSRIAKSGRSSTAGSGGSRSWMLLARWRRAAVRVDTGPTSNANSLKSRGSRSYTTKLDNYRCRGRTARLTRPKLLTPRRCFASSSRFLPHVLSRSSDGSQRSAMSAFRKRKIPRLRSSRAILAYQVLGRSVNDRIEKRIRSIVVRKELTSEWKRRGIKEGKEYAVLTNIISFQTFDGVTVEAHKRLKGLKDHHPSEII